MLIVGSHTSIQAQTIGETEEMEKERGRRGGAEDGRLIDALYSDSNVCILVELRESPQKAAGQETFRILMDPQASLPLASCQRIAVKVFMRLCVHALVHSLPSFR